MADNAETSTEMGKSVDIPESAKIYKKYFHNYYSILCNSQNVKPVSVVQDKHYDKEVLDCCVDQLSYSEWGPVLKALSEDKSLQYIGLRLKHAWTNDILEHIDSEAKARKINRYPVLLTRYLMNRFASCLLRCISNTSVLTTLALEGIPLRLHELFYLGRGVAMNNSIRHLSVHGCNIADLGCEMLCQALRNSHNIYTLSLADCNLTSQAGYSIAALLRYQKSYRYADKWDKVLNENAKPTDPMIAEAMQGLRRLTVSDNTQLGNDGLWLICDALTDDLWIKALDAQDCGVTEQMAQRAADLLEINTTIEVIDLRRNAKIATVTLENLVTTLSRPTFSKVRYPWMRCRKKIKAPISRIGSGRYFRKPNCANIKDLKSQKIRPKTAPNIKKAHGTMLNRSRSVGDIPCNASTQGNLSTSDQDSIPVLAVPPALSIVNWDSEKATLTDEELNLIEMIKTDEKYRLDQTEELNYRLRLQLYALNPNGGLLREVADMCDAANIFMIRLKMWVKNEPIDEDYVDQMWREIVDNTEVEQNLEQALQNKLVEMGRLLPEVMQILKEHPVYLTGNAEELITSGAWGDTQTMYGDDSNIDVLYRRMDNLRWIIEHHPASMPQVSEVELSEEQSEITPEVPKTSESSAGAGDSVVCSATVSSFEDEFITIHQMAGMPQDENLARIMQARMRARNLMFQACSEKDSVKSNQSASNVSTPKGSHQSDKVDLSLVVHAGTPAYCESADYEYRYEKQQEEKQQKEKEKDKNTPKKVENIFVDSPRPCTSTDSSTDTLEDEHDPGEETKLRLYVESFFSGSELDEEEEDQDDCDWTDIDADSYSDDEFDEDTEKSATETDS